MKLLDELYAQEQPLPDKVVTLVVGDTVYDDQSVQYKVVKVEDAAGSCGTIECTRNQSLYYVEHDLDSGNFNVHDPRKIHKEVGLNDRSFIGQWTLYQKRIPKATLCLNESAERVEMTLKVALKDYRLKYTK